MGRVNYRTARHNRLIAETADAVINAERREIRKAAERAEKEASIEYKTEMEQRKCIQYLYQFEKAWKKELSAKVPNEDKIVAARFDVLKALDKSAADSIGRILAEIKQTYLNSKELLTVDVSVDVFYADFKNFCKKNFVNYYVTKEEMDKILTPYIDQNVTRIKNLGEMCGNDKAAQKLLENIEIVKKIAIKEKELTV